MDPYELMKQVVLAYEHRLHPHIILDPQLKCRSQVTYQQCPVSCAYEHRLQPSCILTFLRRSDRQCCTVTCHKFRPPSENAKTRRVAPPISTTNNNAAMS
jgi:hypothetical protein